MIPDYQTVMLPLLRYLGDGQERSSAEAVEAISVEFGLTSDESQKLLPSGTSTVIGNRIGWAKTYLKKAGLIDQTRRGFFRVSKRGLDVLARKPTRIDVSFLEGVSRVPRVPRIAQARQIPVRPRRPSSPPHPRRRWKTPTRDFEPVGKRTCSNV